MDSDELFARKLQEKFDEDFSHRRNEEKDESLAQSIAKKCHQMSDSESDEETDTCPPAAGNLRKSPVHLIKDVRMNKSEEKPNELNGIKKKLSSVSPINVSTSQKIISNTEKVSKPHRNTSKLIDNIKESNENINKANDHESIKRKSKSDPLITSANSAGKVVQSKLPLCQYGDKCYRKNPTHFQEYSHGPRSTSSPGSLNSNSIASSPGRKRLFIDGPSTSASNVKNSNECRMPKKPRLSEKLDERVREDNIPATPSPATDAAKTSSVVRDQLRVPKGKSKGFADRLSSANPYGLFLTKSFSVPATHKDPLGCVLPDLLHPSMGNIVETAQLSFLVNADFMHSMYEGVHIADKPLLVLYGELEGNPKEFPKGNFIKVKMPFLYGTHHTKMMLLLYDEGMRVVVHTANMRPDDWFEKTQGVWVSPLLPRIELALNSSSTDATIFDSPTQFRVDLLRYLQSYKLPVLARWTTVIRAHDFSAVNAVFLGHVPGYHAGPELRQWGHLAVRRWLARNTANAWRSAFLNVGDTIVQCSSIGSLGKDCSSWLSSELGRSLGAGIECPAQKMKVIYPTEENIRTSSQGWGGGSCLPYNSTTHTKQPWLARHFHEWRCEERGRSQVMPHIKTYTRLNEDCTRAQYLLLTSANLSKAAWGQLQKQESQLFIRSYEAGVLLLPKYVTGEESFPLNKDAPMPLSLPFDLPLTPYPSGAQPWFMDTKKKNKDINGETYP